MSDMTKRIREYAPVSNLSGGSGGVYEVTLISEGEGSSGYYSREVLEQYGPITFGPDVPNFYNHVLWYEDISSRDIKTAASKIIESWFEVEDGVGKVKAKIEVMPSEREFIEFFRNSFGLSISVAGTFEYDESLGRLNVTSFDPTDPYRSVDHVVAAGARGKIDKMLEHRGIPGVTPGTFQKITEAATRLTENFRAREGEGDRASTASVEDKETKGMTMEKEILEAIQKLTTTVDALVARNTQEAEAKADETALAEARAEGAKAFAEASKLIQDANLLSAQVDELSERAMKGEDITAAVASAKVIAEQAREGAKSEAQESGRMHEGSGSDADYEFKGFGE